jgi:hypothetical protein
LRWASLRMEASPALAMDPSIEQNRIMMSE